jgi:8-oxo-dGTP diphosphatase
MLALSSCPERYSAVTTDVVIFTIRAQQLQLLLVKREHEPFSGMWALPGGFVGPGEDLEACAVRQLQEETGVSGVYLEQLYTFGAPARDPRGRVVSVAYYALVAAARLQSAFFPEGRASCFTLENLPPLAFDHAEIVAIAHQRLAAKLAYSTIAFQFMPEMFTLRDLQTVYEIILQHPLDKRNFRKYVLTLDAIEETGGMRRNGNHRPAKLYRLKHPSQVQIIK